MSRGVSWSLSISIIVAALIALAGCGHYFYSGEREAWRREAEVACLSSGAVKETPQRVRISAINGPGMCGAEYPLRVSALGETAPLGYDDEPLRPPGSVGAGSMPQSWPGQSPPGAPPPPSPPPYGVAAPYPPAAAPAAAGPAPFAPEPPSPYPQQTTYPPQPYPPPPTYPSRPYPSQSAAAAQAGVPLPLHPPDVHERQTAGGDLPPGPPHPYPGAAHAAGEELPPAPPTYAQPYPPATQAPPLPPLGPERAPMVTGAVGPVELHPAATLACPIVSALDQWIGMAVQPAALKWFRVPVAEIKQISAYSCRGMNGNPGAHISEHAFGNALDIAEFILADGHRVSVQYGWRGSPEEQGFLHDVQAAACAEFTTVLAPGANVYHYNHIHVDLMRHAGGRHICEPAAIPGEVVAERARGHFAAQHYGEGGVTGSIRRKTPPDALGYSAMDDDRLPLAVPGED